MKLLGWKHSKEAVAVLVALLLYAIGIKLLLLPVILLLNARYLPLPAVFRSWTSRLVVSFMFVMVLLQIAAALQFLILPSSNFLALAAILVLLQIVLWWFIPVIKQEQRPWFSRSDAAALIVAGFFLIPFAPILLGINSVYGISKIGGIQAIDATNHYVGITEMMREQHLDYTYGHYYPKGFHIATGFVENTVMADQFSLGWRGNAWLFFAQYIVSGIVLAYVAFYFALSLLRLLGQKAESMGSKLLLAFTLGPPLALFYLIPFVPHGFLNYYYVIATILLGATFLVAWRANHRETANEWGEFLNSDDARWALCAYFILVFGAAVSWPLLIPPLVLAGVWFALPSGILNKDFLRQVFSKRGFPLLLLLALQLVPIYFQLRYTADSSQGINAVGGLRIFHSLVLLAGVLVLFGALYSKQIQDAHKKLLANIYLPMTVFITLLIALQYFTVGEVRYYGIKTAMLLEIMLLVLAVVLLVRAHLERGLSGVKYAIMLPAIPLVLMIGLMTTVSNPLKDLRDLFRDYSNQEKPAFFDHDMSEYARLGSKGDIAHYNSTILHYNSESQKFSAHSQATFWANMMRYDGDKEDFNALLCNSTLYSNLAFGTYTNKEQLALITKVRECAKMANEMNLTYYIITDKDSVQAIRDTFGDIATLVY